MLQAHVLAEPIQGAGAPRFPENHAALFAKLHHELFELSFMRD